MALADYRVAWHCHGHAHPDRNLHRPHCALPHVQKVFPLWVRVLNTRLPEDACGQGNLRLDEQDSTVRTDVMQKVKKASHSRQMHACISLLD